MVKVEELEKVRAEVAQLGVELARFREAAVEVPSLRAELEAAYDQQGLLWLKWSSSFRPQRR